uniref:Uncharacterized protein n=1 Tax=Eutreptiella gymnastica TaxID=73025 RepID=A0A7S4FIV6_9EUGL
MTCAVADPPPTHPLCNTPFARWCTVPSTWSPRYIGQRASVPSLVLLLPSPMFVWFTGSCGSAAGPGCCPTFSAAIPAGARRGARVFLVRDPGIRTPHSTSHKAA